MKYDFYSISNYHRHREIYEVSREIEKHHNLFYEFWRRGEPIFTDSIPTACIRFEPKTLRPLKFYFNPEFWDSLDNYNRAWVISHESLHAFLNHGVRAKTLREKYYNDDLLNVAMDLAINHLTLNSFGYDRDKLMDWEKYCWVDLIFEGEDVSDNLSFEQYIELLIQKYGEDCRFTKFVTVDGHEFLPEDFFDYIKDMVNNNSHDATDMKTKLENTQGQGSTAENLIPEEFIAHVRPSKHWEKIVKKWKRKGLTNEGEAEQWVRPHRRILDLPDDIVLPADDYVGDLAFAPSRLNILCFMDVSGSCTSYVEHFVKACRSIPKKRFRMRTFVFDDRCTEIDIQKYKTNSGGGTNFYSINDKVNELINEGIIPDLIFVITDGQATHMDYTLGHRYNWFIIDGDNSNKSYKEQIPVECRKFNLEDFFKQPLENMHARV